MFDNLERAILNLALSDKYIIPFNTPLEGNVIRQIHYKSWVIWHIGSI